MPQKVKKTLYLQTNKNVKILTFLPMSPSTAVCKVHTCQIESKANVHFIIITYWLFLAFIGGVLWVDFWLPPKSESNGLVCEIIFSLGLSEVAAMWNYRYWKRPEIEIFQSATKHVWIWDCKSSVFFSYLVFHESTWAESTMCIQTVFFILLWKWFYNLSVNDNSIESFPNFYSALMSPFLSAGTNFFLSFDNQKEVTTKKN